MMFHKAVALAAILALQFSAQSADAQNRVIDLATCEGERALVLVTYWQNQATPKRISEMCLSRSTGVLSGAENLDGFEIVRRQSLSERYEIIRESTDATKRTSLEIAPSITTWSFYDETNPEALELNVTTSGSNGPDSKTMPSRFFSMRGYLSDGKFTGALPVAPRPVFLWAFAYRSTESDIDPLAAKIPPLAFTGSLTFDGDLASFDLAGDSTYAPEMGEGTASVDLTRRGDGILEGSIELNSSNSRLAGFSEGEWRSASCKIGDLRGHVLGDSGELVRAIALGDCSVLGANGDQNEVAMEVFLEAWAGE